MKRRIPQICTVVLFLSFLVFLCAGTFLIPKEPFSETEKRYLAQFPQADWESISSGQWGEKLEAWLADHIPFRNFFVGLDAGKEFVLGQQGEIRVRDGYLLEAPVTANDAAIEKNLAAIGRFAQAVETPVTLALVPSAGWAGGYSEYTDDAILARIADRSPCETLDLTGVFAGHPELFYRTDHHWTSRGAWTAYTAIANCFGRDAAGEQDFSIERIPAVFQGSTYSRSALWLTKPEDLELWHGSGAITVTSSDNPEPHGVFFRDRLQEADKYTVFLDGNHPLVRLENPEKTGKLLVIRDSYSNCLGPFLAESWGQVVLADLRYYRQSLSALAQEGFDNILILYSIGNFLTDANIVLLR